MTELGRLERVELRTIWLSEPQGFTPWLARDGNLKLLGETIGIELELDGQERDVGPFRADILCKDTDDGSWVLIENQLEKTDHLHLGQLLTYAAGLDAVTVVWVASRFIEEHRATLDWLNRITADSFRFFGFEIELWRIGSSPPAPKFNVVAKPNDWTQSVAKAAQAISGGASDERQQQYVGYWAALGEMLAARNSPVRLKKPQPQYWMDIGVGRSGFTLTVRAGFRDKWISAGLTGQNDPTKAYYRLLYSDRSSIEQELGFGLDWHEKAGLKRFHVEVRKEGANPADVVDWPNQHAWLADKLELLERVFRPRVRALDAKAWELSARPTGQLTSPESGLASPEAA
jgi:hypothetical protein